MGSRPPDANVSDGAPNVTLYEPWGTRVVRTGLPSGRRSAAFRPDRSRQTPARRRTRRAAAALPPQARVERRRAWVEGQGIAVTRGDPRWVCRERRRCRGRGTAARTRARASAARVPEIEDHDAFGGRPSTVHNVVPASTETCMQARDARAMHDPAAIEVDRDHLLERRVRHVCEGPPGCIAA